MHFLRAVKYPNIANTSGVKANHLVLIYYRSITPTLLMSVIFGITAKHETTNIEVKSLKLNYCSNTLFSLKYTDEIRKHRQTKCTDCITRIERGRRLYAAYVYLKRIQNAASREWK